MRSPGSGNQAGTVCTVTSDPSRKRLGTAEPISPMTLAHKRVQVARPTAENSLAQGIVGTALPAIGVGEHGQYFLIAEDADELEIVQDLVFGEAELESLP